MTNNSSLIQVENLHISLEDSTELVKGIDFAMGRERVALVGESGSGKSLTARSLMGLLPASLHVQANRFELLGEAVLAYSQRQWLQLRGKQVSMVLQDPKYALNPSQNIGRQVEEPLVLHQSLAKKTRVEKVEHMLDAVGLPNPAKLRKLYPHQLSGGMGQRVMLAIALINDPQFLIADEPTSALDHAVRDQVLELIASLVEERNMGLLLISHDLQQVADYCERVLVMYQGQLIDQLPASQLSNATHPYTQTLWSCRPNIDKRGQTLPVLDRGALATLTEGAAK
ncbi:Oligopeptide transport ATP-binding protein OppD [Marinomonas spartinae]|uniref:ABC-type dipeptide transporter n=1 Tax=Marinomonas spartinae TaxID=1792290 RepID=A0A1A8TVT5_9GAMM|nr:ABC transporter ATP-binding protein [Marinomonas spartinae]SBS37555.1 Oligopeptide transport ATP-binding protein OppD [Marinomonas spartinae]SBS38788.1 Oligopeptide transport ATP-binding protein OppD [Marinomonas spartinae]